MDGVARGTVAVATGKRESAACGRGGPARRDAAASYPPARGVTRASTFYLFRIPLFFVALRVVVAGACCLSALLVYVVSS